ncbi:MAG: Crp/Fnr family transcriptional regulator [Pigmentiphaga sp.]|nr:Crp/Fnr family transcriptional regulator [Pigmentiphaga sp.]
MTSRAFGGADPHSGSAISETWMPRGEFITHLMESGLGDTVHFQEGKYLFSQGEIDQRFYVLVSGKVYVSNLSAEGHESTFNIMGPGSVIGEAAAVMGLPRYSAALVLEDSELLQFQASQLEDYIRQSPRFGSALIHVLSLKQRQAVARLHQAVFDAPDQRILRLLEQIAETHADRLDSKDSQLRVQLTHEQIGNLTNLSRVTVTRSLQKLKRDGRVDLVRRTIVLSGKRRSPDRDPGN